MSKSHDQNRRSRLVTIVLTPRSPTGAHRAGELEESKVNKIPIIFCILLVCACAKNIEPFEERLKSITEFARGGDAEAQSILGMSYQFAVDVPQDYKKAARWYAMAANQGSAESEFHLGILYLKGLGVQQNNKTAVYWLSKAANQGHAKAQGLLGNTYLQGQAVEKNLDTALEWILKSAEQGNSLAQYSLGMLFEDGTGVPQDFNTAMSWYLDSAKQGEPRAQHRLGILHRFGKGTSKDNVLGYAWTNLAAAKDYKPAIKAREEILKLMTPAEVKMGQNLSKKFFVKFHKIPTE